MRISELEDENEDLKQQVKDLEDTIYEYGEQEE
jgi:cell division protein FtsB